MTGSRAVVACSRVCKYSRGCSQVAPEGASKPAQDGARADVTFTAVKLGSGGGGGLAMNLCKLYFL